MMNEQEEGRVPHLEILATRIEEEAEHPETGAEAAQVRGMYG
jgi:hypothetical protein